MHMRQLKDAKLKLTLALPNGAANVTSSPAIDLGVTTALGQPASREEAILTAPAMTTAQMPDAKTMKYDLITADSADLATNPVTLVTAAITQTGAGGAGCAAATYNFVPPSTSKRYFGFKATGSASGDATGAAATLEMVF